MRWALLVAGLLALSCFNLYWRWPADTGAAHWSEWAVFFGSLPFSLAGFWLLCAAAIRRRREMRGEPRRPLSAAKAFVFATLMTAPGWLPSANPDPRRFVLALLTLT